MELTNILDGLNQVFGPVNQKAEDIGQNVDLSSIMQLANNMPHNLQNGIQVQLNNGNSEDVNNPVLTVMVETKSVDDLMSSDTGRQQINHLGVQLEHAMNSLSQGVHMVQDLDKEEVMVNNLQNLKAEALLGCLAELMIGQGAEQMLQGVAGVQSLQSLERLTQTLDQLPALRGLLEKFYRFLDSLQTSNPTTAKGIQQLFASAAMSLQSMTVQGMGNGGAISELEDMMQMLERALQSLNTNLEMLNGMVQDMQQMMHNPTFLQAVNNTHCLVKSLTGEQNNGVALGCMQQLLQSVAGNGSSERVIASLNNFMTNFVNNPQLLQSLTDLMKVPSLDTAFSMIQMMIGDLDIANADAATAMQTLQNMLRDLLGNQRLLETLTTLLQNPEASTVYENAMEFLRSATLEDPATQQVLMVVNDTISRMWKEGDFQQAGQKIKEILTTLTSDQDPSQPLSNAQQALIELLEKLLDFTLSANNTEPGESTTHRPTSTVTPTPRPGVTSTPASTTTLSPSPKTSPPDSTGSKTSTPSTADPSPRTSSVGADSSSMAPTTTRRMDTRDGNDNGATSFSLSAVTMIISVLAVKFLA